MPHSALFFAWRKPGLTPAQFRQHYEEVHMPLIKSLTGDKFPVSHTRHYLARSDDAAAGFPAVAVLGEPADFDYDSVAEIVWEDVEHFQQFMALYSLPDLARQILADEEKFIDRSKMRAVYQSEVTVTRR